MADKNSRLSLNKKALSPNKTSASTCVGQSITTRKKMIAINGISFQAVTTIEAYDIRVVCV